jgi:hypothetical protein
MTLMVALAALAVSAELRPPAALADPANALDTTPVYCRCGDLDVLFAWDSHDCMFDDDCAWIPEDEALRLAGSTPYSALGWVEFPPAVTPDRYGRFRVVQTPGSQMTLGRPILRGDGLDKSTVRRVLNHGADDLERCYEREQLYAPTLDASITVQFVVTPSGGVQTATGDGADKTVAKCAADVIGRLLFPKPANAGVVEVLIPIDFSPGRRR